MNLACTTASIHLKLGSSLSSSFYERPRGKGVKRALSWKWRYPSQQQQRQQELSRQLQLLGDMPATAFEVPASHAASSTTTTDAKIDAYYTKAQKLAARIAHFVPAISLLAI